MREGERTVGTLTAGTKPQTRVHSSLVKRELLPVSWFAVCTEVKRTDRGGVYNVEFPQFPPVNTRSPQALGRFGKFIHSLHCSFRLMSNIKCDDSLVYWSQCTIEASPNGSWTVSNHREYDVYTSSMPIDTRLYIPSTAFTLLYAFVKASGERTLDDFQVSYMKPLQHH